MCVVVERWRGGKGGGEVGEEGKKVVEGKVEKWERGEGEHRNAHRRRPQPAPRQVAQAVGFGVFVVWGWLGLAYMHSEAKAMMEAEEIRGGSGGQVEAKGRQIRGRSGGQIRVGESGRQVGAEDEHAPSSSYPDARVTKSPPRPSGSPPPNTCSSSPSIAGGRSGGSFARRALMALR